MTFDGSLTLGQFPLNFWSAFDVVFILIFFIYFIFSLIVAKQISLMTRTVITLNKGPLVFLGLLHTLVSFFILAYFVKDLILR